MAEPKQPDYTLNVFHHADPETKTAGVMFVVQTTKIFVSFQYDILLDISLDTAKRTIRLAIKGLHAPELLMPGTGPALGERMLSDIFGHYTLLIVKQDKTENSFDIDIARKEVVLLRSPQHPFIHVMTESIARS